MSIIIPIQHSIRLSLLMIIGMFVLNYLLKKFDDEKSLKQCLTVSVVSIFCYVVFSLIPSGKYIALSISSYLLLKYHIKIKNEILLKTFLIWFFIMFMNEIILALFSVAILTYFGYLSI
jgi:hypothetical protein